MVITYYCLFGECFLTGRLFICVFFLALTSLTPTSFVGWWKCFSLEKAKDFFGGV
jgi:hypothetical protein